MSTKKPAVDCSNCHQLSSPPTHCCINGHQICANCKETGISCPICMAPLEMIKVKDPNQGQKAAGGSGGGGGARGADDGGRGGEENEDPGLKGGAESSKNKKRKHDGTQDDFIESDENELVIKVKTGQTIKIINDEDNSTFTLKKNPGAEFSLASTSQNNTSRASFSFGPNGINNINSSISNSAAIRVGSPIVGNSSTTTIQIEPPVRTMGTGNEPSASEYGPGSTVSRNNSTFTANGATINGSNNTINGNDNVITGANNKINGNNNKVDGANNTIIGNTNEIGGFNNISRGWNNKDKGFNNVTHAGTTGGN